MTSTTHIVIFDAIPGSQRGTIDDRGCHRVTSTRSPISHATMRSQLWTDLTILIDFCALSAPQYDARGAILIARLYTNAQELFAFTQVCTDLAVCTRPLTTRNDGTRGYQESRRINTTRSFVTSEGYQASLRTGPRRGSCTAAMRVICMINHQRKRDKTAVKGPTEKPLGLHTPGPFFCDGWAWISQIVGPSALLDVGKRKIVERGKQRA